MKYLLNADDFGKTPSKTAAIDAGMRSGQIHRASLMMNMESTAEAVALAKAGNYMERVCFHLNLTEGEPLTEAIKHTDICDKSGSFHRISNKRMQKTCFSRRAISAIRQECVAQIQLFRSCGFTSVHLDSHLWCLCNVPVWFAIRPLLRKYGFRTLRSMDGHFLSASTGKLHSYFSFLKFLIGLSRMKWAEAWAGCMDEFQTQVVPNLKNYANQQIEIYVHPDIIEDTIMDRVFSYQWEKKPIAEIAQLLSPYESCKLH